jgi:dynamin 1-like protein
MSITEQAWACSELSDENMRTAIKNSGGVKGTLLIPDAPFELLVRRAITRLLAPALQCKEFVHSELLRVAAQCVPPDVARFPRLQVQPSLSAP